MKIPNTSFTFSPFVTLCALVLAVIMLSASYWQWQRYLYKLELQERFSAHSTDPALVVDAAELTRHNRNFLNEKIRIRGKFDLDRQVIIINRSDGRGPGFWLVSPFLLQESDTALLLSRGFIPFEADTPEKWGAFSFPELGIDQEVEVVVQDGIPRRNWLAPVNPPSEKEKEFKEKWAYVDVGEISKQLPYPVVEGIFAQQLQPLNDGTHPQEAIHIGLPPSTHFWYSIEWILLALSTIAGGAALQLFPKRRGRPERVLQYHSLLYAVLLPLLLVQSLILSPTEARATSRPEEVREKAKVVEHLGEKVDLSLRFRNAAGEEVSLAELSPAGRPIILAPVYYECPELCGLTQTGIAKMLNEVSLKLGKDFSVVSLSFDPRENPEFARNKASKYREMLSSLSEEQRNSWHFLVGDEETIQKITSQIGFFYEKDGNDFMHAAVLAVLSPDGMISRYLYGIRFPLQDVELALVEASEGKVGSLMQRALMFCFRYDHIQGRYTVSIMEITRIICIAFVLLLFACLLGLRMKERWRPSNE